MLFIAISLLSKENKLDPKVELTKIRSKGAAFYIAGIGPNWSHWLKVGERIATGNANWINVYRSIIMNAGENHIKILSMSLGYAIKKNPELALRAPWETYSIQGRLINDKTNKTTKYEPNKNIFENCSYTNKLFIKDGKIFEKKLIKDEKKELKSRLEALDKVTFSDLKLAKEKCVLVIKTKLILL